MPLTLGHLPLLGRGIRRQKEKVLQYYGYLNDIAIISMTKNLLWLQSINR